MGNRSKSLIARIDPGQGGRAPSFSRRKGSLTPKTVYDDANKYLGMVFKLLADLADYHPQWLFHDSRRRGRKGRKGRGPSLW